MRLFAAVSLSDLAVQRLTSLRLRLSSPRDGLRWSSPEQWHVTLQFFGDLEQAKVDSLRGELERLRLAPAEISIQALGLFPAKGILFASIEPSASLLELQASVQNAGARCAISADSKPFHPHITLARSRGKTGLQTLQKLCKPSLPAFGPILRWSAPEYVLLQSELDVQGAQYTTISRYSLAP